MNSFQHSVGLTILKNGIRFLSVQIPNFPFAVSSVWINAGSRFDLSGKEGLAHLFEHLFFTRTKTYPNRQKRLEEVEKRGFMFNAFTSLETQHYFYTHSVEKTDEATKFLIDGLWSSIFDDKDIDREKSVISEEEARNHADPSSYIWRLANKGLWRGSALAKDIYGTKKSLQSVCRKDMVEFYKKYFIPSRMVFLLISPLTDTTKVLKEIDSSISAGGKKLPVNPSADYKIQPVIFEKNESDVTQVALSFVTISIENFHHRMILDFIRDYLASGWTSRLVKILRVKHNLTYWVWSETDYMSDSGYLRFYFSINSHNVSKALRIFEQEIVRLKTKFISQSDLDNHKNKIIADFQRKSLDYDWLMRWYGYQTNISRQHSPALQQYISLLKRIESKTIAEIAQTYLIKDNFSVAVLGKSNPVDYVPNFQ